jgi:hypothetical protein
MDRTNGVDKCEASENIQKFVMALPDSRSRREPNRIWGRNGCVMTLNHQVFPSSRSLFNSHATVLSSNGANNTQTIITHCRCGGYVFRIYRINYGASRSLSRFRKFSSQFWSDSRRSISRSRVSRCERKNLGMTRLNANRDGSQIKVRSHNMVLFSEHAALVPKV